MRLVMPVEGPVVTAQVASFTGSRVVRLGLSLSRFDVDFIENCFLLRVIPEFSFFVNGAVGRGDCHFIFL